MMKIFTTQTIGLLQKIEKEESFSIEETARLLAQSVMGDGGRVILYGVDELDSVVTRALLGEEPMTRAVRYEEGMTFEKTDRIFLIGRRADDPRLLKVAKELFDAFIPFGAMTASPRGEDNELEGLAYTYICTHTPDGYVPTDSGERVGRPHSLLATFIFEAILMQYRAIVSEELND